MQKHVGAALLGFAIGTASLIHPAIAHKARHAAVARVNTQSDASEAAFNSRPGEWRQTGKASFYGYGRLSRYTASGAVFDRTAMTAAHPWLPFGTRVRVREEATGREVLVTITDRLPTRGRVIDLSVGAARQLGMLERGLTVVSIEWAV